MTASWEPLGWGRGRGPPDLPGQKWRRWRLEVAPGWVARTSVAPVPQAPWSWWAVSTLRGVYCGQWWSCELKGQQRLASGAGTHLFDTFRMSLYLFLFSRERCVKAWWILIDTCPEISWHTELNFPQFLVALPAGCAALCSCLWSYIEFRVRLSFENSLLHTLLDSFQFDPEGICHFWNPLQRRGGESLQCLWNGTFRSF